MTDDSIIPPAGGQGRSFGRFLNKLGHNNIAQSAPREQATVFARVNGLEHQEVSAGEGSTQQIWKTKDGSPQVLDESIKEGGHNYPGTLYDKATLSVAKQLSPDMALTFNQRIVDFFNDERSAQTI